MKIQFQQAAIEEILSEIADNARTIIQHKVYRLENAELITQLRTKQLTNTQKVEAYLKLTPLNVHRYLDDYEVIIESHLLAQAVGLHVLAMKKVRDELMQQGKITTRRKKGKLTICYKRPTAPTATAPVAR
jgi:hypothetical protein